MFYCLARWVSGFVVGTFGYDHRHAGFLDFDFSVFADLNNGVVLTNSGDLSKNAAGGQNLVANLKPARIRGVESQGMLLAADLGGKPILATFDEDVPPGTPVR